MSDQAPNSLSVAELENLLKTAEPDKDYAEKAEFAGLTKSEMIEAISEARDALYKKCGCPMTSKLLALMMIVDLQNYHEGMSDKAADASEKDCAYAWARDAGQLSAAHSILTRVSVDHTDWIADEAAGITDETED